MAIQQQMNETNDNLTVLKLREQLASTIGQDLIAKGFLIDKKLTGLTKKVNEKDKIRISFHCYDYKPIRVEFQLLLIFGIHKIDEEAEKFYHYCGEKYNQGWTLVFSEGDFHPKVRHLEHKLRSVATHIVTDNKTMNEEIEDCRKVLQNEIIPKFPTFSIFEEFQNFVLNDYDSVIRLGLTVPSIISAKLKGREELVKLVEFLWASLDLESKSDLYLMKKLVRSIVSYADYSG